MLSSMLFYAVIASILCCFYAAVMLSLLIGSPPPDFKELKQKRTSKFNRFITSRMLKSDILDPWRPRSLFEPIFLECYTIPEDQ